MIENYDNKKIQNFEYETTAVSEGNIIGTCELGNATIQMINDSNEYSNLKGQWIKTIHGSFYIHDVEPVQEKVNIKLSCYDIKYKLDSKYDSSLYTWPMTLKEWRNAIGTNCGITFDNSDFPNSSMELSAEPYVGDNPSNRNVISQIAQAGCSFVDTDKDNIFYFKWFEDTTHKVDDWLELTTEKEISKQVNVVVLGRGDTEDNVYYPATKPANPIEFRIDNNYILDPQIEGQDQRYNVIQSIYNRVNGFSCLVFNMRSQSIDNKLDIKLGQKISYKDIWGNDLTAYIMTKKITYLGGNPTDDDNYEITLSAEEIKETSTEYSYAASVENRFLKVERRADKQEGIIEDLIETQDEHTTKITQLEMNNESITSTVSDMQNQIIDLSKYTDTKTGNAIEINNKTGNEIKANSVVLKGRTEKIISENIFNKDTMSSRINAYINTSSKWVYAQDSYSIRIPVRPNTKLTINMDNTNESLFRFGFVKTDDIPTSTTTVDIYDAVRLTRPVHMPQELYVGSDARYLIIQMGAGQALTTIDSLSIKEEKLKSINGMKNLFDGEFENGIVNYITGNKSSNTTLIRSKNYIEVKPNTNYKFSGVDYDYTSVLVYEYDKDLNFIQYLVDGQPSQHTINFSSYLTTTSNTKYILFRPPGVITNTNFKIQMEEGTVATEYAPKGQIAIKRVNNSQEQKIYIDLQGNELTEYDKLFIENDRVIIQKKSRHLSLAIADMNNSEEYPGWKNLTQLKEDFPSSNNYLSLITNYISNIGLMSENRISINTNQTGVLFLPKYYNNNLTQTQWKEQHPSLVLDLYYELDTPYEIDLGQIEMPTILSNKNYFSNSEDANMSINYFTNYEMYQMYYDNEKKFNELDSKANDLANEDNEIRKELNNNYTNNAELEQKLDNQKQEIKTEMSTTISQTKESWQAEVLEYINKNGVEKFVNMLVTIDIDGLKLSKSDEDIVSLLNNKGLYVSDGKLREDLSNLLMKVDRAGALFKILEILGTIKEQEIIQKEVIEDTKYGTCQAWYWIGGDN